MQPRNSKQVIVFLIEDNEMISKTIRRSLPTEIKNAYIEYYKEKYNALAEVSVKTYAGQHRIHEFAVKTDKSEYNFILNIIPLYNEKEINKNFRRLVIKSPTPDQNRDKLLQPLFIFTDEQLKSSRSERDPDDSDSEDYQEKLRDSRFGSRRSSSISQEEIDSLFSSRRTSTSSVSDSEIFNKEELLAFNTNSASSILINLSTDPSLATLIYKAPKFVFSSEGNEVLKKLFEPLGRNLFISDIVSGSSKLYDESAKTQLKVFLKTFGVMDDLDLEINPNYLSKEDLAKTAEKSTITKTMTDLKKSTSSDEELSKMEEINNNNKTMEETNNNDKTSNNNDLTEVKVHTPSPQLSPRLKYSREAAPGSMEMKKEGGGSPTPMENPQNNWINDCISATKNFCFRIFPPTKKLPKNQDKEKMEENNTFIKKQE